MEGEQEPREGSAPPQTEGDNAAAKELEDALYYARDISDASYYTDEFEGDVFTTVVLASVSDQMPSADFR